MHAARRVALALMLALPGLSRAQNTDPLYESFFESETTSLPGARTRIFDTALLSNWSLAAGPAAASLRRVPVEGQAFSLAYRITITAPGANSWEPQFMTVNNKTAVKRGDVLFYIVYARALSSADTSGRGKAFLYVQQSSAPWTGLGSADVGPGAEWRRWFLACAANRDYAAGEFQLTVHLGYFAQTLEFAPLIALNLGPVDMKSLPANSLEYGGREPDAAWRAEAADRIERIRKADLAVRVTDPAGNPVAGAGLRARMTRHAFGFGTFIETLALETGADADRYRAALFRYFNKITTPFYWGHESGSWGWESPGQAEYRRNCLDLAAWEKENGFRVRGHNIVWPGWTWLPPRIRGLAGDPAALRSAVDAHVREMAAAGKPFELEDWDVVNEPYFNHDLMDILGDGVIAEWLEAVAEIDPLPLPMINETGDITGGGHAQALDNLARLTEFLLGRGAPLRGLGFQAHFGENLTAIPDVIAVFDRFGRYGLPLKITEFDIDTRDETGQAEYTRDLLTAVFSHPSFDNFIMWGFWEGAHWKPNGAMVRRDWRLKPNGRAYERLVLGDWWTDASGAPDTAGAWAVRAFQGDYRITASNGTDSAWAEIRLGPAGASVNLVLPDSTLRNRFVLARPYPNPFRDSVRIGVNVPEPSVMTAEIFDGRGRRVRSVYVGPAPAGYRFLEWDGKDPAGLEAASGVYTLRVRLGSGGNRGSETGKMVKVR